MTRGFDVPVALFNFNRPQMTRRVFEVVRQIKPRKLLLVADGPRDTKPDDARLCAEVRAVFDGIDWECEVFRNFSETNLGSFRRNSSGLNWVFETVEEAIILEDDCVPSLSFFPYCEELLERYRDDPRVGVISGNNFGFPRSGHKQDSYYFSTYALTWGWASWRRVWQTVDLSMGWWQPEAGRELLRKTFSRSAEWQHWYKIYSSIHAGETRNAWDFQLMLSSYRNNQYCAIPKVNQVSNIGFGMESTHHTDEFSLLHDIQRYELDFPLVHPADVRPDEGVDHAIFRIRFKPSIPQRIRNKLIRIYRQVRKQAGA